MKPLRRLERDAYLLSRTLGDANALDRGPDVLAKRIARRMIRRSIFQLFRGAR